MNVPKLNFVPRGFWNHGSRFAGAVDCITPFVGVQGWVADIEWPENGVRVDAVCQGRVLACTFAVLPRPEITTLLNREAQCGFTMRWSYFNEHEVEMLARQDASAVITFHIPDAGRSLECLCGSLQVGRLLELIRHGAHAEGDFPDEFEAAYRAISLSGLFDWQWYGAAYEGELAEGVNFLRHYVAAGEKEGRRPSFFFDPEHYRQAAHLEGRDLAAALTHYASIGWKEGLAPGIHFNPSWYRSHYRIDDITNPLTDFLISRPRRNPNPYFDYAFYLEHNQDVAEVDDPYVHYARYGVNENRAASLRFDAEYYRAAYLGGKRDVNPLEHFLGIGEASGFSPVPPARGDEVVMAAVEEQPAAAPPPAPASHEAEALAEQYAAMGLIDPVWYVATYADLQGLPNPALHYVQFGDAEGRMPNPYFDSVWYAKKYFKRAPQEGCLNHYVNQGEREGLKPCAVFDPAWYGTEYGLDPATQNLLSHYLRHRHGNQFAPNAYFSPAYYREQYQDIASANIDAFEHYMQWGIFEGRRGSEKFNAELIWLRYLGGNRSKNALQMFMDLGQELGWEPIQTADSKTVHSEIKANCAPGEYFEELAPPAASRQPRAKAIAFYLPQFHPIAENDAWWGKGFTEWRNIPRGVPRYAGHYQPRVPRDLGFYELPEDDTTVMRRQVELARDMGLHGFCFYYYNFNGRRLLEKPLDAFANDSGIDFPFSIMWANENWTRRWDGMENDVLIRQDYKAEDRDELIDDLAQYLLHPNYIRADGRPVLYIYRADIIPNCAETLEEMRKAFRGRHQFDPLIVMAQTFGCNDPTLFGFDGAIEFPPHKLGSMLPEINSELTIYDPAFTGSVRRYQDAVAYSLTEHASFPLIKTGFPQWDNDARKQGAGMNFHGSTPAEFQRWMEALIEYARKKPFFGEPMVFINAWNEWCEGTYLEPDCHYGYAYLNALSRALHQSVTVTRQEKVVLVGHDAFPSGAQQLLLNIGRILRRQFGVEISFVLMGDGEMVPAYEEIAPTYVATRHSDLWASLGEHVGELRARGFDRVITNSIFSGAAAKGFAGYGFNVCSLIHELPTIVREHHGMHLYEAIRDKSQTVVFPNRFVEGEITREFGAPENTAIVRPQGLYKKLRVPKEARAQIRNELGLKETDRIVLNIGHGDLRKGVDLFIAIAGRFAKDHEDIHFVWLGSQHPNIIGWLKRDIEQRGLTNVHFVDFSPHVGAYIGASDLFFLTSREDPFPSVVLEALALGVPVATFDWGGGYVELLSDKNLGFTIPYMDVDAAAEIIPSALDDPKTYDKKRIAHRQALIRERYQFPDYCADLLSYLNPERKRVSVIVPNYNYGHYLEERLESIFAQTYPLYEIIVLDDGSSDGSAGIAAEVAERHKRILKVVSNEKNSGNVFRQWQRGLSMASGEYVWIAEADDLSRPDFVAALAARLASDATSSFAFSDSVAIDEKGLTLYEDYKGYYAAEGDDGLSCDGVFAAAEFLRRFLAVRNLVLNVSSVLWKREHLNQVFESLGNAAFHFTCAGDWRVYVESCRLGGTVHYAAETLNLHRRHAKSVTHSLDKKKHFSEIAAVQDAALEDFPNDKALREAVARHQAEMKLQWGLRKEAVRKEKKKSTAKPQKAVAGKKRKRS